MHKTIILWALLTGGGYTPLSAQKGFVTEATTNSYQVFDASGRAFVNPTSDVEGSPYFKAEWLPGSAILNATRYNGIRLRLDLNAQEVHYLDSSNSELVLPKGLVKTVIWKTTATDSTWFQCGFPATEGRDANSFYLVLSSGKYWLLHSITKPISERKDEMSGETKKEFTTYDDYYVYTGTTLQRIKKDKSSILSILNDKKEKVDEFITGNKLKLKSMDDVKRIIDYYNTLPS